MMEGSSHAEGRWVRADYMLGAGTWVYYINNRYGNNFIISLMPHEGAEGGWEARFYKTSMSSEYTQLLISPMLEEHAKAVALTAWRVS